MDWTPLVNPVRLSFYSQLWLLLPLCLSVAVVYKAVRTDDVRRLWLETLMLMGYIIAGLVALGLALWGIYLLATGG